MRYQDSVYLKDVKEVQSSNRIPIDLKEDFRMKIAGYLAVKDGLNPGERDRYHNQVLDFIRDRCVERNVETKHQMSKIYNCVTRVGLEKVLGFDVDKILGLTNIGKKSGAILYEIVSYCQSKGLGVKNKQVGIIEDGSEIAKELLRKQSKPEA